MNQIYNISFSMHSPDLINKEVDALRYNEMEYIVSINELKSNTKLQNAVQMKQRIFPFLEL